MTPLRRLERLMMKVNDWHKDTMVMLKVGILIKSNTSIDLIVLKYKLNILFFMVI